MTATSTSTATAPLLIALFITSTLLLATMAQPPTPPSCTQELVMFSPCLPYVSSPPNNLSNTASDKCCDAFSSAMNSASEGVCLCYLVREPSILGFPMNSTRVLSLSSVCPLENDSSARDVSLESLCSGTPILPPLSSTTKPSDSAPSMNLSPEPGQNPSIQSNSTEFAKSPPTPQTARASSAAIQLNSSYIWVLPGVLIFLLPISTFRYSSDTL